MAHLDPDAAKAALLQATARSRLANKELGRAIVQASQAGMPESQIGAIHGGLNEKTIQWILRPHPPGA